MKISESILRGAVLALISATSPRPVAAAELFVYPNKGQSQEQQAKDRYECHTWAVGQTGFDPSRAPAANAPEKPAPAEKKGARGAIGGAALGAAIGAITGADVGESAAIGAGTGVVSSGLRSRRSTKKEQAAYAAELEAVQAHNADGIASYDRALGACLEGREYTIK
jgi:hypothetical protein